MPIAVARPIGRRPRRRALWNSREAFFTDAGIFLLGFAGALSINIVGALPGNEILLFPLLPALLLYRGGRAFRREYLWFYLLTFAWLLGTLVVDMYVGSPAANRMKGIARVVFFALDFMALAIVINRSTRRMIIFALSIAAVMFVFSRDFRSDFLTEWKFGLSSCVTILALLAASYHYARRRYRACIIIYVVLAALNLKFAFRSQMLIGLAAAVLTIPIFQERRTSATMKILRPLVLLALVGGAAYVANQAIKVAARQGLFDEDTADKFESQSEGRLGVLFGGRPETLVAIQAIRDSPILGHGSFAADQRYLDLKADLQYENGYSATDFSDDIEGHPIPTHSHLTMAWVESGILGGLLWIYILVLTVRAILRITVVRPALSPLYCYMLVNFLWDILYSPFGSISRLWGAYLILMSYDLLTPAVAAATANRRRPAYLTKLTGSVALPR